MKAGAAQTAISETISQISETQAKRKRIPLMEPVLDARMMEAAILALQNEKFVLGESVYKFEEEFARFCRVGHAVSTGSGTAALQIALQALGIGRGDGVLTTPFSFFATANAVIHAGARPEFADVDYDEFTLSPIKAQDKVSSQTRALMPVHLYGHPCRMDELTELAADRGLLLVEDACQAHGSEYMGSRMGSYGDAGCFSFYPSKNMTVAGDGGMIVTNNEEVADAARCLRDCGRDTKYTMARVGYTSRLNTFNAAIGRIQLRNLPGWNMQRRRIAEWYRRGLENVSGIFLPPQDSHGLSVYHLFVIKSAKRDLIRDWLDKNDVETGIHYPVPIHLQPPYRRMEHYSEGAFPVSERLSREVLSLPVHTGLKEEDVRRICSLVKEALNVN